jgi:hyaluronan synthase
MQNHKLAHPVEIPDRRIRSKSRPDHSDRRTAPRYHVSFPVEIYIGEGENRTVYHGTARDASDGGLLIEAPDIPPTEHRIRVQFRLPDGAMPEEYLHGTIETSAEIRRRDAGGKLLGVAFEESLGKRLAKRTWAGLRWFSMVVLFLAIAAVLLIKYENLYFFWFDVPVFAYSLLVGAYLITRFVFAAFYRPGQPRSDYPTITVICPVYNEEENIARTLTQLMESAYPAEKLQAIVVNDGSTDRTFERIQEVRKKYPELILLNFAESRGKRNALASGVRLATGEIVVFIDSDSFLEPDALHNMTRRFVDPGIAAVTGHCDVENQWTNLLTKMQAVRYYVAFRVMKAAESVFDSVTCLSGPLAAYRRSVLLEVVDEWVSQTFLGRPATYGDDRSLTNALLKRGYKVVYESSARTTTYVPEDYSTFYRQQLRWKRSWFRESLRACVFMWKRPPLMALSFYLGFLLPIVAPFVVLRALVYAPLFHHQWPFMYIFGVFLMSALLSSVYLFMRRSRLWIYGIHFCFFYMFILVWQLPWAILTSTRTAWGTRGGGSSI